MSLIDLILSILGSLLVAFTLAFLIWNIIIANSSLHDVKLGKNGISRALVFYFSAHALALFWYGGLIWAAIARPPLAYLATLLFVGLLISFVEAISVAYLTYFLWRSEGD